jgi:hypothetical protein
MRMLLLLALAAAAGASASDRIVGQYKAVTETEYAIDLVLAANGLATLSFFGWEADGSEPDQQETLQGKWRRHGDLVTVTLKSHKYATYQVESCLSYQEFGQTGCSMGLKLARTNLQENYGLARFSLWKASSLRLP